MISDKISWVSFCLKVGFKIHMVPLPAANAKASCIYGIGEYHFHCR